MRLVLGASGFQGQSTSGSGNVSDGIAAERHENLQRNAAQPSVDDRGKVSRGEQLVPREGKYVPTKANDRQRDWFKKAKFGLFVHFGLYSLVGGGLTINHDL